MNRGSTLIMSRRHHHHLQPYDYGRFENARDRDRDRDQTRGIEYQDDSLSSINSDEESYLHHHKDKKSNLYNTKGEASSKPNKSDKAAESFHQKDMKIQPHSNNVSHDSTSERLGRLELMLEELIKRNNVPSEPAVTSSIPEKGPSERRGQFSLEPRRHDFTTSMWINKIQEISIQNNWDEKTTISYMESQMSGIIKAWYKSLPNYDYTWPEWKILISKVFPDNTDFITTLKRLVTRLKQADETMSTYYFSKMYLVDACKITGQDAVSCLIDGLNNQSIQEQAKAQNYLTPETLYSQFLMILPEYSVDYTPSMSQSSDTLLNNWYLQTDAANVEEVQSQIPIAEGQVFEYAQDPRTEEYIYHSQDFHATEETPRSMNSPPKRSAPVHSRLDKRFIRSNNFRPNKIPMAAKLCSICGNRGHLARNCRKADKVMVCKLSRHELKNCFFKECIINCHKLDAFIDTGCTTVTIREQDAKELQLKICPVVKNLEVYGGGIIPILGETEIILEVDSVRAPVRAVVVATHIQDVSVVVGQEYLNQKNVCMSLGEDILTIYEASQKLTN